MEYVVNKVGGGKKKQSPQPHYQENLKTNSRVSCQIFHDSSTKKIHSFSYITTNYTWNCHHTTQTLHCGQCCQQAKKIYQLNLWTFQCQLVLQPQALYHPLPQWWNCVVSHCTAQQTVSSVTVQHSKLCHQSLYSTTNINAVTANNSTAFKFLYSKQTFRTA
jgi:hypothetical protein